MNYASVSLSQDDHMGTLDSLRIIAENVHSDMLILSCDTMGDYNLVSFVNEFRRTSPSLLALLCKDNSASMTRCYGSKRGLEKDIIALSKDNRIVLFNSESDFESNVVVGLEELTNCPELMLHSNLLDGHVYLIRKPALDYFIKKSNTICSLKGELVPSLVQMQFIKGTSNIVNKDLFQEECLKFEPTSGQFRGLLLMKDSSEQVTNRSISCHAFIHPGYLLRANTLMGYMEANRRSILDPSESSGDQEEMKSARSSVIDKTTQVNAGTCLVRCVIGADCKIGSKVKITDSVIMDHVTIEDECVISNTVICCNSTIAKRCEVNLCLVASGYHLTAGECVTGELLGEEHDVDIEDL